MLTEQLLKSESELKKLKVSEEQVKILTGLTSEQINAVTAVSKVEEDTVIGSRTSTIYRDIDKDVRTVSGLDKNKADDGTLERTIHYIPRIIKHFKEKAEKAGDTEKLTTDLAAANDKVKTLEKQIADGAGDEGLKTQNTDLTQKLTDAKSLETQLRNQLEEQKTGFEGQLADQQNVNSALRLKGMFNNTYREMKFKGEKAGITPAIRAAVIENAESQVSKLYEIEFPNAGGIIFRNKDEKREIARDEKTMNPHTTQSIIAPFLKDVLIVGQTQGGGGGAGTGNGGGATFLNLGGMNKVQADEAIENHIIQSEGIGKGTAIFQDRVMELRKEHKVADLSE